MKNNKNKRQSKNFFDPINNCTNLTAKLLKVEYNSSVIKFKLDEDSL